MGASSAESARGLRRCARWVSDRCFVGTSNATAAAADAERAWVVRLLLRVLPEERAQVLDLIRAICPTPAYVPRLLMALSTIL